MNLCKVDLLDVTVAIPTYRTKDTIFRLLDSLRRQSYRNFRVMIVYKSWPDCKDVLDRIKEQKGLDVEMVRQDNGLFEEAINTIYRKADADIVIHTDDDAYVSENWVKDHIELHKKYKKVGMATGMVIENVIQDGAPLPFLKRIINKSKWRMNKHTIIDKPIDDKFRGYGMYIGKSGMLVDTGKMYNMMKTFKQHGVNMSWKKEALEWFKLPGFTKYGGGNEAAATLEALHRGYIPVWFDRAQAFHPVHQSLSRGASISSLPVGLTAERVLFSYYTNNFAGYKIKLEVLKLRNDFDIFLSAFLSSNAKEGYKLGYAIVEDAIENSWHAKRVRRELINRLNIIR